MAGTHSPAFGLAGVKFHTWTGFGSVPYWNAYVAATEMHGSGTLFDAWLENKERTRSPPGGSGNTRGKPDRVTSNSRLSTSTRLPSRPKPPPGSFHADAAARGKVLFDAKAQCATCHVPPLFTEPGNNLHAPKELGIVSFQADRSPTHMYRTAPLAGLWAHQKGGFFHDGRFATLLDVVNHYDDNMKLKLTEQEKADLIEYLKSL